MSHGVAGSDWKSLESKGNRLQHMQHEKGRFASRPNSEFIYLVRGLTLAGELGFEPRFSESESDVLPLNYSPIGAAKRLSYKEKRGQRRENTPIFLLQMPQSVLVDLQQLTTRPKNSTQQDCNKA